MLDFYNKLYINSWMYLPQIFIFKFLQNNFFYKSSILHLYINKHYITFFSSQKKQVGFHHNNLLRINSAITPREWFTQITSTQNKFFTKFFSKKSKNINFTKYISKFKKLFPYQKLTIIQTVNFFLWKVIRAKFALNRKIWKFKNQKKDYLYLNNFNLKFTKSFLFRQLWFFLKKKKKNFKLVFKRRLYRRRRKIKFLKWKKQPTFLFSITKLKLNFIYMGGFTLVFFGKVSGKTYLNKNFLIISKYLLYFSSWRKFSLEIVSRKTNKLLMLPRIPKLLFLTTTYFVQTKKHLKKNILTPFIFFKTKVLTSFIFKNIGVFFISRFSLCNHSITFIKSQLKKKVFSFLYPGEEKKFIFLKRKRRVLTRLIVRPSKYKNLYFSYKTFFHILKVSQYSVNLNNKIRNYSLGILNYLQPSINNARVGAKDFNFYDVFSKFSEPYIKRVRFKPGYQRLWRQVRATIQKTLNVKFRYQKRLTRYLTRFLRYSKRILFSYSEATLTKILIFSKLLPNLILINFFSSKQFIYLNSKLIMSLELIIIQNDFVQLIVTLWYYIISRWFLNWTIKRIKKFKRLVFFKNKAKKYRLSKTRKQKSHYIPNWIPTVYLDDMDVKPYLEVDYLTLSTFVITDTYIISYFKPDNTLNLHNGIYALYNWKYIT